MFCYSVWQNRKNMGFSLLPQQGYFDDDDDKETELFKTPLKGAIRFHYPINGKFALMIFVCLWDKIH